MRLLELDSKIIETFGIAGLLALTIGAVLRWMMATISTELKDTASALRELASRIGDAATEDRLTRDAILAKMADHSRALDDLRHEVKGKKGTA